jgi:hypothetical protein
VLKARNAPLLGEEPDGPGAVAAYRLELQALLDAAAEQSGGTDEDERLRLAGGGVPAEAWACVQRRFGPLYALLLDGAAAAGGEVAP